MRGRFEKKIPIARLAEVLISGPAVISAGLLALVLRIRGARIIPIRTSAVISAGLLVLLLGGSVHARMDPDHFEYSLICESCHSEIYKQWKTSYHAVSWEDSLFQDMYAPVKAKGMETKCLSCHAPIAWRSGDEKVMESISREGVNCDFCHTIVPERGGEKGTDFIPRTGRTKTGRIGNGKSIYHAVKGDVDFGSAEYCASCHHLRNQYGVLIYSEYESWKASAFAKRGVSCRDCHMPESAMRASNFGEVRQDVSSHRFPGWRSQENLRSACSFTAKLTVHRDFIEVGTTISNRGAGHTFPGGTPLRELVVRVIGVDDSGEALFRETPIRYGVELEVAEDDSLNIWEARSIVSDTRIRPGEKRNGAVSIPRDERLAKVKVALLFYPIPLELVEKRELEMEPIVIYERSLDVR